MELADFSQQFGPSALTKPAVTEDAPSPMDAVQVFFIEALAAITCLSNAPL
jgi:hypothetical protein